MKKTSSINAAQHPPASNLHLEKVDAVGSVGVTRLHSYQHGSDLPLLIKPLRFPPPHSDAEVADRKHITEQSGVANETQLSDSDDDTIVDNAKYELLAKANQFTLSIDPDRGYRGTQLDFWRFDRPHMRAFHASWACQFASSFGMFSQAPLLAEIQHSLHLSKSDIWWTNLWMMIGGIPVRFLLGATCDSEGARTTMTYVVAGSAIPCILTGFIATNLTRLTIARTFLGALDAFVPGQYWITSMFVREVSGTAMAITGGLGASGSGITQLVMGSFVFPLMLNLTHGDKEWAWRWALVVPAALALLVSWFFYHNSDDCPLGQVTEVKKAGLMIQRSAAASFRAGIYNMNSWILFLQFAGSCGVDFTMCNGAAIYFHYQFNQSIAAAGAFAFLYGVSAIFARGLGGWISDQMGDQYSFKGRLYSQLISMTTQGLCNIWFARTQTLESSLFIMILFSIFVQMSMGTCFGIVSYVDGPNTGSIAGIVGAGGNAGAAILAVFFMTMEYRNAMELMGWWTIGTAALTPLIVVRGFRGILYGEESSPESMHHVQQSPLLIPGKVHRSPHLVSMKKRERSNNRTHHKLRNVKSHP